MVHIVSTITKDKLIVEIVEMRFWCRKISNVMLYIFLVVYGVLEMLSYFKFFVQNLIAKVLRNMIVRLKDGFWKPVYIKSFKKMI